MQNTIRTYERECVVCGESFTASRRDARYCAHKCATRAYRSRQKLSKLHGPPNLCKGCEALLVGRRWNARFCSKNCASLQWYRENKNLRSRVGRTCPGCLGPVDEKRHANAAYCSLPCREAVRRVNAYGLTIDEYRSLLESQDHRCAICGCDEVQWTVAVVRDGWHIDHCHDTGKVRGILCPPCTLMIGYAKDSVETLRRAVDYLS